MTFIQALILGIVQGLTEFLPVSSSAHLVIVPFLLNWHIPEELVLPFDVLVQLGTLLAVIVFFWNDLWQILKAVFIGLWRKQPFKDPQARLGWYLVLATIPAGLFGLVVKKMVDQAFQNAAITGLFLILTAGLLFIGELYGKRLHSLEKITWLDALIIGLFQAVSVFPGISRSGSSISGGMVRQLDRPAAARFAFLMSVPIMLAAGLLEVSDALALPNLSDFLPLIAVGFMAAAVIGFFSIRWFINFVGKHSLNYFAYYCILVGAVTAVLAYVR
jgi:undecaprenyl-diphosphatase